MKVLAFADYYEPGFLAGGPIKSLQHTFDQTSSDVEIRVVTRSHDLGSASPYPDVSRREWTSRRRVSVWYCSRWMQDWRWLKAARAYAPDIYYINSYFSPRFSRIPMLLIRLGILPPAVVLLAPRGELLPGASNLKRRAKNGVLRASRLLGLHRKLIWQATTTVEAAYIRERTGCDADVIVCPDTTQLDVVVQRRQRGVRLRVVYLARVSPIKNLDEVLVAIQCLGADIQLDIYGPLEDEAYWAKCRTLMGSAGPLVAYRGVVSTDRVPSLLREYDFLVLPSSSENFGHSILEALLSSTPVIITDTNPWADHVANVAGYVVPVHDFVALSTALQAAAKTTQAEYELLQAGCARAVTSFWLTSAQDVPAELLFQTAFNRRAGCLALMSDPVKPTVSPEAGGGQ